MPKRSSFTPIKVPGREKPWKLEIPANVSETGKRARYFFATKSAAENFADEQLTRIRNFGTRGGGVLTPSDAEQAAMATELLKPYAVTLNEVVRDWITRHKAATASETFGKAVEQYRAHLAKKRIKGRVVSTKYQNTTRSRLEHFAKFNPLPLPEITAKAIDAECAGLTASMRTLSLSILSALFGWCMEAPREWVKANPTANVPRQSTGGGEIETFAAKDVQTILSACDAPDLLAYHALGFFSGIRPDELQRVKWEMIHLAEKSIVLPAKVTKTGHRRVIEINDTLAAWLAWIKPGEGTIVSSVNLRKRLEAVRASAGVSWIQDGMRHTYASNWLAIHKDEHRLRDNLGHKSSTMLWEHYHKATTEAEARKFWAIVPKQAGNVVAFRKGAAA